MFRPTHLTRKEGLECLPGVGVRSDLALFDQAVETGFIRVAHPLMPIDVVPESELVIADAASEPGARLPSREPLLLERLAGAATVDY